MFCLHERPLTYQYNPNLKSHRVSIPSIMSAKKCSDRCLFSKAKGKTKSNHEVLGLCERSFRLSDVITFWHYLTFISQGTGIIKKI